MDSDALREYRRSLASGEHTYDINNSYGVYDYYKYYRHNRPKDRSYYKMNEKQYYKLIRTVNEYLIELLFKNMRVELPNNLGELVVQRRSSKVFFKDGKLRTNKPVNWDATIRLWFDDKEAERNKTLVRYDEDHLTNIEYKKTTATFRNKAFYDIHIIRRLKKDLSVLIKGDKIETPFFVDGTNYIKSLYNG